MTPTRAAFRTAARLLSRRTYSQHPSKTSPSPSHSSSLDVSSVGVSQSQLARLRRLIRQQSASFRLSPQYQAAARRFPRSITIPLFVLLFLLSSTAAYELIPSARHLAQAVFRCGRLMYAVILDVIDYKRTFAQDFGQDVTEMRKAYSACHKRSAERMLRALEDLGGIYIKLGQHLSSVAVIPIEWSSTMAVLQDRCPASSLDDIDAMILRDTGSSREVFFSDWDPKPLGIASIAQVHLATERETGRSVAVKLQHPNLEAFSAVDLKTVNFAVAWVDRLFPAFEFAWLAREVNENLPIEMDFRIEAKNAARTEKEFSKFRRTSLYIPEVRWAKKRILVMEYIDGARVDNLEYLDRHGINRNLVAQELSKIFSQMVYLNGFFHADPHQGNVLIRPRPERSRSPYNFEVVLLDHGQYFSLSDDLRVNYARFWLTLIEPSTPAVQAERRKYAKLMGNIGDDLYPILESAITGRMGMEDAVPDVIDSSDTRAPLHKLRAKSMMELNAASEEEQEIMRNAVIEREGLLKDIFQMLRQVPRRIVMVIKLNDLTRSLDKSLETTHGQARVFMIVARYCLRSVYEDSLRKCRELFVAEGLTFRLIGRWLTAIWYYRTRDTSIWAAEKWSDIWAARTTIHGRLGA